MMSEISTMELGRSTIVSGRSTIVPGRSIMVQERSTMMSGRSTMVSGRSNAVFQRSTMVSGRSTMVLGRSTSVSERSIMVSGRVTIMGVPAWLSNTNTVNQCEASRGTLPEMMKQCYEMIKWLKMAGIGHGLCRFGHRSLLNPNVLRNFFVLFMLGHFSEGGGVS